MGSMGCWVKRFEGQWDEASCHGGENGSQARRRLCDRYRKKMGLLRGKAMDHSSTGTRTYKRGVCGSAYAGALELDKSKVQRTEMVL